MALKTFVLGEIPMKKFATLLCCLFALCFVLAAQETEVLTNEKVLEMVNAKFDEDMIVTVIQGQPNQFKTGMGDFMALNKQGVSQKILKVMMTASKNGPTKVTAPTQQTSTISTAPSETGIFVETPQGLKPLPVETAKVESSRSGGLALRSRLRPGLKQFTISLKGAESPVQIAPGTVLVLKGTDSTVVAFEGKKERKFTTFENPYLAQPNGVLKLGEKTVLNLEPGEYGILRQSSGGIEYYTFGVTDDQAATNR